MSIRINGDKEALRRTTSLPSSHAAFTICGCFKVVAPSGTREAHLIYTQNTTGNHAETLYLTGTGGVTLRGADSYGTNQTATVATVPSGGASGTNWFFAALVGSASGAGGLRACYKPIGGGALTSQSVTNSPGTNGFDNILIGDLPFGTTGWLDGLVAHVKVYNRALSDAELETEAGSGAPVSTTSLLSYHSFSDSTLATALQPDQGSGVWVAFTSNPTTDTDMPVFSSAPTLTLNDTLPSASGQTRPGAPTILTATVLSARSVQATWSAASGTVTGYRVYAQRAGDQPFVIAETSGGLSATGSGLSPASGHTITVRAFNSAGESEPSAGLPITTYRLLVRLNKVEQTIFGESSVRMLVWQPATAPNTVGGFLGETGSLTIGAPVFDAIENANVCTVTADIGALSPPTVTGIQGAVPAPVTPGSINLSAGNSVLVMLAKGSSQRYTGIESATVIEEA